ncbi:MAG: tetratricopeptide repeat protein [Myxococcota bacterium]
MMKWTLPLGVVVILGCATKPGTRSDETPVSADENSPAPDSSDAGPVAESSAADDSQAAEGAKLGSTEGIDDDTPVPEKGPAREAFERAVAELRTSPERAAPLFVQAAEQSTYFYAALYNAANAYDRSGDVENAERYYREALKLRPDYGYALANLYLLLARSGREPEGAELLESALKSHDDRAGPHLAAAIRAYSRKELAVAEQEALRCIRIDERQVAAMRIMAQLFYDQERYGSARFAIENALVLEPGNALLHLLHGHVLVRVEEEPKALMAYGKAASLRPELAEAQEHYAVLLKRSGDPDKALTAFEKVASLRPGSALAQLHLGNGYRATKRFVDAEKAYQRALELDPNLHAAHFNLAIMYIDNPFEGRDELEQLQTATASLKRYQELTSPGGAELVRIEEYLASTDSQIRRIEKRRERERRRQLIKQAEEEEKRAQEAAAAAAGQSAASEASTEPASTEPAQASSAGAGDGSPAAEGTAPATSGSPADAAASPDVAPAGETPAP